MTSVLIVEDEPAIQELIAFVCQSAGMDVSRALTVADAKKQLTDKLPDIILLDWMLPDCSGLDWLRQIRKTDHLRSLPVIMLTARSLEDDRVAGLDSGADDYIVKPFSPRELVARINAVIRRHGEDKGNQEIIECGRIRIDTGRFEASVDGKELKLSTVEFKILSVFAKNAGRVYSRQQLIDMVWGYGANIDERTIDVHMLRLRKRLTKAGMEDFIQTIRGVGYKAVASN